MIDSLLISGKKLFLNVILRGYVYHSPCGDPFYTLKDLNLKAVFVIAHVALLLVYELPQIGTWRMYLFPERFLYCGGLSILERDASLWTFRLDPIKYLPLFIWGTTKSPKSLGRFIISSHLIRWCLLFFLWRCVTNHIWLYLTKCASTL